jgi:hypothetical protein
MRRWTMPSQNEVSLNDLAAAVIAQDPELRNDLRSMVKDMIGMLRYQIRYGDDSTKVSLARTMVPQLLRSMQNVEQDEERAEERKAYDRILASARGE